MTPAKPKAPTRFRPKEPTREEYRDWYHAQMRRVNELRSELEMAKATIEAQAWSLAYRSKHTSHLDDDIPF